MSLSDQKTTFAIMPNSHVVRLQKRDFARQIGSLRIPTDMFLGGA